MFDLDYKIMFLLNVLNGLINFYPILAEVLLLTIKTLKIVFYRKVYIFIKTYTYQIFHGYFYKFFYQLCKYKNKK